MNAVHGPSSEHGSLAEQAYRLLEEQLVTLKLAPGELVAEKDLMEKAGIGRTPVREAIQKLSAEGLLQVLPRKGLMVTPLRRSDLGQIIEARRVMERLLVVKATERATPDQRQAIRILGSQIEVADTDVETFFRLDQRLNELLEAACSNRFLVDSLTAMHAQCRRLWYLHRKQLNLPRAVQLHGGLARAVADGNGAGAIRALDEIIRTLEELLNELDVLS
ncbi:MAG: GntR family transcriptional regulator [Xanthomonadales bacterium]|nr:GntR family transcriptional regulator [Xanthomonadales bacterium]MDH4018971.1 GntR family transcriptional regulator [Xanthomonadales bacterium]